MQPSHTVASATPAPPSHTRNSLAEWIKETTAIKKAAEARLSLTPNRPQRMSGEQIGAMVEALGGLLGLLRLAEPRDRAEIYSRLGLRMTYRPGTVPVWCPMPNTPGTKTVIASAELAMST
jgi:hypothetical protein